MDSMDIMDIRDIMEVMEIMDIMDIMDIIDIMDIMIITAWLAMAGAVSFGPGFLTKRARKVTKNVQKSK